MANQGIIKKLKKSHLLGRSGSAFPTWLKWQTVKGARAKKKYVICNASSGEPAVFKDEYILKNYPEELISGIKTALRTMDSASGYMYLRKDLYLKFKKPLEKLIKSTPISLVKKKGGYLAGEETCVCEVIEGKYPEPRIKPPYPTEKGLWGYPTLINNVETFYQIARIAKNQYKNTRFYSISGDVKHQGVYELPIAWSIEKILKQTKNYPNFTFFVQSGGGACGEILLSSELKKPAGGPGAIIVFDRKKTKPFKLMKGWADFFLAENCDKCVPCREGIFRIDEMLKKGKIDKKALNDISFVMKETSFCGLGRVATIPFETLINKVVR